MTSPDRTSKPLRKLLRNAALVALYSASGMLGLHLAATGGGYAAPIWLPTGFAVAAVLLYGEDMLPGIWVGGFITNFFVRPELSWQNILLASVVATGNSGEALAVRLLLRKFKPSSSFLRLADVKEFIRAAVLAPLISATVGVLGVSIAHSDFNFTDVGAAWTTWWVGDTLGALVIAPMLITLLSEQPKQLKVEVPISRFVYLILLFALGLFAFRMLLPDKMTDIFIGFALYSIVIWCAFTLPLRSMFVTAATICALAIARAYEGLGLFGTGDIVQRLSLLQVFLGCISVMIIILNAVVSERLTANELARQRERSLMRAEKMSALGEMASGIAHEIGNPLMVIYARTEQALTLVKEGQSSWETLGPVLEKIDAMAARIDQIVKSVRFFSRNAERDPFRMFSVKSIIEDTLELCRDRFRKHGAQLTVDPVSDQLTLECKPVLLAQVLLNLLNNARDAVQDTAEKWVRVSFNSTHSHVEIAVEDSGNGVPAELRQEIFEPFFTTKSTDSGTGLGLSVSRNIVESHHGSLTLDEGSPHTRFVVRLPVRQPRSSISVAL